MRRALVTCPQMQHVLDRYESRFSEHDIDLVVPSVVQQLTEDELIDLLPEIDGIIVGDDPISERVLSSAPRLQVISKWGVGIDNIDLRAAESRSIAVRNTPGVFGEEVADVVVGYLILLSRQLHRVDAAVRAGAWAKPVGVSLAGRTLGVVGLGDIGQAVARRAAAMHMNVLGNDVLQERMDVAAELGLQPATLAQVLSSADVVSLNCPLTGENRHMINAATIATMKRGAWLINTARGGLVDERALVEGLKSGQLGSAAMDVFEQEPLPAASPLRTFDNVVLGSHNSSNTIDAVIRTSDAAFANLLSVLTAETVQ